MKVPLYLLNDNKVSPNDVVLYLLLKRKSEAWIEENGLFSKKTIYNHKLRIKKIRKRNIYYKRDFYIYDEVLFNRELTSIGKLVLSFIINHYKNLHATDKKIYNYIKKIPEFSELKNNYLEYFNLEKKINIDSYEMGYDSEIVERLIIEKKNFYERKIEPWFTTSLFIEHKKVMNTEIYVFGLSNNFISRYFNVSDKTITRTLSKLEKLEYVRVSKIYKYKKENSYKSKRFVTINNFNTIVEDNVVSFFEDIDKYLNYEPT